MVIPCDSTFSFFVENPSGSIASITGDVDFQSLENPEQIGSVFGKMP